MTPGISSEGLNLVLSALPKRWQKLSNILTREASRRACQKSVLREKLLARKQCSGLKCKEHTM